MFSLSQEFLRFSEEPQIPPLCSKNVIYLWHLLDADRQEGIQKIILVHHGPNTTLG